MQKNKKGFTLIELLIVIGILAVLSTATVLMLNPAQMLAESRDTQRMSDLRALATTISLMQSSAPVPVLGGGAFVCGANFGSSFAGATSYFTDPVGTILQAGVREINGTGWMAANLDLISGGSPMATLPTDPSNSLAYNYQYQCTDGGKYELNANLESTKYTTGATNKEIKASDGGNNDTIYETGTTLAI